MKKIILITSVLLFCSLSFAKSFSFGIEGAAGINTAFVDAKGKSDSDFDFIPGFRFGGFAEFSFNDVTSLKTKVLFHHQNGFSYTDSNGKTKVSFPTADIPVLLNLCFTGLNVPGRLSIFAGPNFSFRINSVKESHGGFSTDQKIYDFNDIFAFGMESGAEYAFSKNSGFAIGLSALFDFTDFSCDADFSTRRLCIMPYLDYKF